MSLSWFLSLVLITLFLLLLFGSREIYWKRSSLPRQPKKVIFFFVIALSGILVWMIWHFIGFGTKGSPEIPHTLQRRLAYTGYYFGRSRELILRGANLTTPATIRRDESLADMPEQDEEQREIIRRLMPTDALELLGEQAPEKLPLVSEAGTAQNLGFTNPALQAGELLTLKPVWTGETAQEWTVSYRLRNLPLRVSEKEDSEVLRCVNVPNERWLKPGDTIFITRVSGNQTFFTSFQWTTGSKYWGPFQRTTNSYYYGQGTISADGSPQYTKGPGTLMSEVVLSDGAVLANLVRRAKKEFRDHVGSIEPEWWSIFGSLMLIREKRDDRTSRIGLIISDSLLKETGRQIYINYSGQSSQPLAAPSDEITTINVLTGASVSYGVRGRENSFALKLPGEVTSDAIWGQIVSVPFTQPRVWPLPPNPNQEFIITSTNEYIPLDGYLLDTGNPSHSFYAKAQLNEALAELSINDGKNVLKRDSTNKETVEPRKFELGNPATLGDYDQGVLFGLFSSQSSERSWRWVKWLAPKHSGRAAALLIVVNAILFLLLLWKEKGKRPTLLLVWSAIWGIGLTLMCIRVLLIYRVSLSPPLDATSSEVRNVFDKGVDYALLGLLAFALFTLVLNLARRKTKQITLGRGKVILLVVLWAAVIVGYTVAGKFLGTNQAFLSIRISIADHLLLVAGLAILARHILEHARALTILLMLLTLALEVLVVKDAGSIIYSWSFLFVIITIWGWRRQRRVFSNWFSNKIARYPPARRMQRVLSRPFRGPRVSFALRSISEWGITIFVPLVAISTFLVLPYILQAPWMRKVVEPALPDTAFYRFASFTDSEDVMLTTKRGEEVTDMSKLLDNSLQRWQMLLYASRGLADPVGYGRAPLSKIGMTYPTSVSDCAFATYVLAEHGRVAATLLLVLYFLLGLLCVVGAWHFDDNMRHRTVVLIAVAGFFAFNALYMASANIGFMTFTGQNMPMLGLASGGDLLQGLMLLCLTGWMLLNTQQESKPRFLRQRSPVVFRWSIGIVLVSLVWLLTVAWYMGRIKEATYRDDHDLKAEIFEQISRDLPRGSSTNVQANAPLILRNGKLEVDPGGRIMEIEEQYRIQFNERTDKFNPQGGLYYLERVRGEDPANQLAIRLNRRFFFARSPFSEVTQWRGRIIAGGDKDPTLYALGSQFKLSLSQGGLAGSIDLAKPAPARTNSSVLLREDERQYFQLQRTGEELTLHPKSGDWSIFVNGERTTEPKVLEPLSIIVIERRAVERQRRNLIYLGPTGPILSYVRWRNGGYRRMFPEGGITLPYFLGSAADRAVAMETQLNLPENERIKSEIALAIDLALHKKLQQRLTAYAATRSNYRPFRTYPNRISATVIDAFSGEVLAIPSWPLLDANKPQYETLIDKLFEPARSRFENNGNLIADHVVGSTIKPIVFTTLASQFWPERNLARLRFFNRTDASRRSSSGGNNQHPHWRLGGINIDVWDCNSTQFESGMEDFLVHSLDYPEGLLGMFGMISSKPEMNQVLVRDDQSPDLSYNDVGYRLDLTRVGETSVFTLQDQNDGKLPAPLARHFINRTLLFSGLNSVFNFETDGASEERAQRACTTFLPSFANSKLSLAKNEYLDNVLAKRLEMNSGDFMGVRQGLVSCFLGGAPCVFNNVMMAEAAARLATGKRVFARIEDVQEQDSPAQDLPAPLNDSTWRNENVLTAMELVGRIGTARALTTTANSRVNIPANYRMIYKTGTIVEGNEGRESEALMFVIGRWENGNFVRNETVAGFVYMEKSKNKDPNGPDGNMKKFEFAAMLLNETVRHLALSRR